MKFNAHLDRSIRVWRVELGDSKYIIVVPAQLSIAGHDKVGSGALTGLEVCRAGIRIDFEGFPLSEGVPDVAE
jgi:hypothetical protein